MSVNHSQDSRDTSSLGSDDLQVSESVGDCFNRKIMLRSNHFCMEVSECNLNGWLLKICFKNSFNIFLKLLSID